MGATGSARYSRERGRQQTIPYKYTVSGEEAKAISIATIAGRPTLPPERR
jgi:hypothetical protein